MAVAEDYRNTEKCPVLSEVREKKDILEKRIRENHKMLKIMYNTIKDKEGAYFEPFVEIYNHKCAYCGASRHFTDIRLFEIDHFICESAFPNDIGGRAEAGKVQNLAFSCYSCNRGKSSFHIKNDYQDILNPDNNSISKVFLRNDEYYIKVKEGYSEDKTIQQFYEKLLLGSEARRLDFLLIEMRNLVIHLRCKNAELAGKLEQCMARLMKKKNHGRY